MTEIRTNGNGVWKWIAGLLAALMLGMGAQMLREPKDTVSEKEMQTQILVLENKIDTLNNEVAALRQSVNQQSTDIAGIAEKVGVTAHPVVAPAVR